MSAIMIAMMKALGGIVGVYILGFVFLLISKGGNAFKTPCYDDAILAHPVLKDLDIEDVSKVLEVIAQEYCAKRIEDKLDLTFDDLGKQMHSWDNFFNPSTLEFDEIAWDYYASCGLNNNLAMKEELHQTTVAQFIANLHEKGMLHKCVCYKRKCPMCATAAAIA